MVPKCGENCPIHRRRKKRRILSRLWLSCFFFFFGPKSCLQKMFLKSSSLVLTRSLSITKALLPPSRPVLRWPLCSFETCSPWAKNTVKLASSQAHSTNFDKLKLWFLQSTAWRAFPRNFDRSVVSSSFFSRNRHLSPPNWHLSQERKISPKRKFLGRISRGHPGVLCADIPAQNFGKASIWARTSMARRRGRPRPQDIFKNFGQKNFGLNFRSLLRGQTRHLRAQAGTSKTKNKPQDWHLSAQTGT